MLKTTISKIITLQDWDNFVKEIYNKPYSFQQQDGCMTRRTYELYVPADEDYYENSTLPLKINGEKMGVSLKSWLTTDPGFHKEKMNWDEWEVELFWERNFYPHINEIANDLLEKGLIKKGTYLINIHW